MSTSDGAQAKQSSDDPVLAGALSEMQTEGGFNPSGELSDLGTADTSASQPSGDVSAAPAAAQPTTGDVASDPASTAAPEGQSAGTPAADPLAGTEPFAYNGKTYEGIYRVPGEGLMIPEDKAAAFTSIVERAEMVEALDRASREATTQVQTFERLSQWNITDDQGQVTETLTGVRGLEARYLNDARKDAAIEVLDGILSDPTKLLSLLAQDSTGKIGIDPSAVETLQMRLRLAANDAETKARTEFQKLSGPVESPAASAAPDYSASAPKLIETAAGAEHSVLTPEDKQFLSGQLDRYVRSVTEEDRRYDPTKKLGAPIVDAKYGQLVQHIVSQRKTANAQAKASEKAGAVNAGMERGRQPAKQPPKPAAPVTPPKQNERKRADWNAPLESALTEMGIPR